MTNPIFKGCGTALITPFTDDGKAIDFVALEKLIEFQITEGIDSLVILGTTGEASTISKAEKDEIIIKSVKAAKGRVPVIIGTGANSTAASIENSKAAEKLGADALLVVTPYYNKCTQKGLVAHYGAIADSVSLPVIAYNVPPRTGVNLLPETFLKICEGHKNVVAIKEASSNIEQISECVRLTQGIADVYSGDDAITLPCIAVGGMGVISVAGNIIPRFMHELSTAALNDDYIVAKKFQLKLLPLIRALFSEVNPTPVKAATKLMGLTNGVLRQPLIDIEEENLAKLKVALKEFGLVV